MEKVAIVISMIALALSACGQRPVATQITDNANIQVDTLFTKDGCTMYRFEDARTVYYVKCDNGSSGTQYSYACGKGCVEDASVLTGSSNGGE